MSRTSSALKSASKIALIFGAGLFFFVAMIAFTVGGQGGTLWIARAFESLLDWTLGFLGVAGKSAMTFYLFWTAVVFVLVFVYRVLWPKEPSD